MAAVYATYVVCLFSAATAGASGQVTSVPRVNPLRQANGAIETLVSRVSRSVVQVVVTSYQPDERVPGGVDAWLTRTRSIGSGVVIDSHGFILTNAHVVAGAQHIDVVLPAPGENPQPTLGGSGERIVRARLAGVANELDLALLAIDEQDLPALPIADSNAVHQGELVFAFGSPAGLANSVSMGMVSATARLTESDAAMPYVQTDAAINPGNSGGPLVNADGELIGLNTFIKSASGGNEGLGFAIPGSVLALAYPQLRDYGHLHRAMTGLSVQPVTPLLRAGLGLQTDAGLLVSDVAPGGPAAAADLRVGDVITVLDGRPVKGFTMMRLFVYLYGLTDGQRVRMTVARGDQAFPAVVTAMVPAHVCERPALRDMEAELVEPLGIFASHADAVSEATPGQSAGGGVMVTGRLETVRPIDVDLERGDVICALNGVLISTLEDLRHGLDAIPRRNAVVLQLRREGRLTYVAFERN